MRRTRAPRLLRSFFSVVVSCLLATTMLVALAAPTHASTTVAATYTTRGVIASFGPERKFVNIAHEKIEGYMPAMTMPFEPRTPKQLAALKPGDHVRFTFTATDDGRRLLDSIDKE